MNKILPRDEYLKQLAKKIVAVGVIISNKKNEILIVKPSYRKDGWSIPGGTVDKNESLIEAAHREVLEEVGIQIEIKHLLLIGYKHQDDGTGKVYDSIQHIFVSSKINENDIKIDNDEIIDYKFVSFKKALGFLTPSLKQRLSVVKNFNDFYYIENGKILFK